MRVVLTEDELVTGEVVLTEIRDVLARRLKVPDATIREIVAKGGSR